jgi:hypothetical protein
MLTLDLTPELEERLKEGAQRFGLSPEAYAARVLDECVPAARTPVNGAELVAYWRREGLLGLWADRTDIADAPEYARELRRRAERRERT